MNFIKLVLLISIILVLSGCAGQPTIVTKEVIKGPDDSLLVDCDILEPPDHDTYVKATLEERESMLSTYCSDLINNAIMCNKRFEALRDWKNSITTIDTTSDAAELNATTDDSNSTIGKYLLKAIVP